jgi:hypothetical protein
LTKFHGDGSSAGTDWARGSSGSSSGGSSGGSSDGSSDGHVGVLGQLQYSAYFEVSYDDVWEHYAWHKPLPWWFPLDFGKVNSSYAWDHEEHVQVSETQPVAHSLCCQLAALVYPFCHYTWALCS